MVSGRWAGALVLVLLMACALWWTTRTVVIITVRLSQEEARLVRAVPARSGETVRLSYNHSVEKTPVEGVFVIADGPSLRIRETRMASVGTGLPNTVPERTRREGEWIVVDEGMKQIDGLPFRWVDINLTQLTVGATPVPLAGVRSGSLLLFNVEGVHRYRWWRWRVLGIDWIASDRGQDSLKTRTK